MTRQQYHDARRANFLGAGNAKPTEKALGFGVLKMFQQRRRFLVKVAIAERKRGYGNPDPRAELKSFRVFCTPQVPA